VAAGGLVALAAACATGAASTTNGAAADGGGASNVAVSLEAGTAPSGLSCLGVLKCSGACSDVDAGGCVEGCLAQTRPSSKAVTTAFATCIDDNQCADATCIQAKCEGELSACVSDDASDLQGTPTSEPAPAGSVPAELVGGWNHLDTTLGASYLFAADGSTKQLSNVATNYYCDDAISLSSTGVTTVTGDSLVYHRVEGTQVTKTCGKTASSSVGAAEIRYRYALGTFDDGQRKLSLFRVNDDGTLSTALEFHHD
jgi:hypothetical protein